VLPVGKLLRHFLSSVILAGLMFLCGCQTATQSLFTAAGPGWHVQQGQALWRPQRGLPEFGGDLVLASDGDGRCLIQFDKTPVAILFAQTTSTNWLIRFPQRQMGFTGIGPGPARFSWLYLHRALAGGWKTPAQAKRWRAFFRREFIPETLVVGLARRGGLPRPGAAAL
jgi:hypothetical protein